MTRSLPPSTGILGSGRRDERLAAQLGDEPCDVSGANLDAEQVAVLVFIDGQPVACRPLRDRNPRSRGRCRRPRRGGRC